MFRVVKRHLSSTSVTQLLLLFLLCYLLSVLALSGSQFQGDVLLDSAVPSPPADRDHPVCRGFLDGRRGRVIWGWVCAAKDGRPCQVQVLVDGTVTMTVLADNRRPDLVGVCADLHHGYTIQLPILVGSHEVTLQTAVIGSNHFVTLGGPLSIGAEPRPPSRVWVESLSNQSIALRWEGSLSGDPIARYEIELDGSVKLLSLPGSARRAVIEGLAEGAKHSLKIRAVDQKSVGQWSAPQEFRTFSDEAHDHQYLMFLPTEGFTNQLVAILHAAAFAKAINFTLIIPSLYSRTSMVRSSQVRDVEDPATFRRLPFSALYDVQIFIERMSAIGIRVVERLPREVRYKHILTRLPRHASFDEALSLISIYKQMSHVCLDIGPSFFRFVPRSCDDHKFLWDVFDALYLTSRIRQAAATIRNSLRQRTPSGRWNALHHRNEKDAQETWKNLIRAKNIGAFLQEHGFDMNLPLYVACGDPCDVEGLDDLPNGFVRKIDMIPSIQDDFENAQDLLSAVELLVCIEAANFAGPSFSAFSHLIMSIRGRSGLPYVATVLPPGEEMANLLGETTPAVDCSAALIHRQTDARKSMRVNEGIRLAEEAIEGTPDSEKQLAALTTLAFKDKMVSAAARLADELREGFPFHSERLLLRAIGSLQSGSPATAVKEFSEALRWPAGASNFGISLRNFVAAEPQIWTAVDELAPGLRHVVLQHYSSLDGKRILLFSHNLEIQGAPLCLLQLVEYLVDAGVRVSVVSPFDGPLRQALEELSVSVAIAPQFALKLDFERFDVILLNTLESWWPMESIPQRLYPRVVWWVHESTKDIYWKQYPTLAKLFPLPGKHVFVTGLSKRNFAAVSLPSAEVIHNGVPMHLSESIIRTNIRDEVRRSLGLTASHFLVSLIGSVNRHKNQLDFLKAANLLIHQYNGPLKPRFLIAGFTGEIADYEAQVFKEVQSLQLSEHVHLLNKSPDVMKYFAASDAYACPSVVESFGRTIIEAMSFAVPVVAYASDGIPEVLQEGACGYLVPTGDWKLMASILMDLSTNPTEAARMGLQGRHCVTESYTEKKMLHNMARALNLVAGSAQTNRSATSCPLPKPFPGATCVDSGWLVLGGLDIQQDISFSSPVSFKGAITQRQGTTLQLQVKDRNEVVTATGDIVVKGLLQLSLSGEPNWFAQYVVLRSDTKVQFAGKIRLRMRDDPGCEFQASAYISCNGRCLAVSFSPLACSHSWKVFAWSLLFFGFVVAVLRYKATGAMQPGRLSIDL